MGPTLESDAGEMDRWCAAVGPPVIRTTPASELRPIEPSNDLTVVTWNVHVGGADVPGFLRSELGYACDGHAGSVPRHFVLLIQEAYRGSSAVPPASSGWPVPGRISEHPPTGPRLDVEQIAERCGLALFYAPSMRNGAEVGEHGREDRGSAILSTLPLTNLAAVELPLEAQRRVTVVATVPVPGGDSLRVASVHLDVAGSILRVLSSGGSMRVRQADGLTEALDRLDPHRVGPIVAGGDLNTWSARETVVLRLLRTFPESPAPGNAKTRSTWPADHLFYRQGEGALRVKEGSYRVIPDDHGSDHRARLLVLEHQESAER
jgi:endonuclease/exonuclease/phosphatase family metal-dependent hydrolase